MSNYFKYFPKTIHTNRTAVDITRRNVVIEDVFGNPYVFLPYTVKNDDRPEDIANLYYGDPNKVWLVYYSNNIIDPYSQWPLSTADFDNMIIKKYEEKSGSEGYGVIAWTQNETIDDNIVYYQNVNDSDLRINRDTFVLDETVVEGEWRPIRIYEYEDILNENKRNIYLIDAQFANLFENDLKRLLNE
jgi:hypothetical protein